MGYSGRMNGGFEANIPASYLVRFEVVSVDGEADRITKDPSDLHCVNFLYRLHSGRLKPHELFHPYCTHACTSMYFERSPIITAILVNLGIQDVTLAREAERQWS